MVRGGRLSRPASYSQKPSYSNDFPKLSQISYQAANNRDLASSNPGGEIPYSESLYGELQPGAPNTAMSKSRGFVENINIKPQYLPDSHNIQSAFNFENVEDSCPSPELLPVRGFSPPPTLNTFKETPSCSRSTYPNSTHPVPNREVNSRFIADTNPPMSESDPNSNDYVLLDTTDQDDNTSISYSPLVSSQTAAHQSSQTENRTVCTQIFSRTQYGKSKQNTNTASPQVLIENQNKGRLQVPFSYQNRNTVVPESLSQNNYEDEPRPKRLNKGVLNENSVDKENINHYAGRQEETKKRSVCFDLNPRLLPLKEVCL